jgi:hypothetical protein
MMKFTTATIFFTSLISFSYATSPVIRSYDTVLTTRNVDVVPRSSFEEDALYARELYERVFHDFLVNGLAQRAYYDDDDLLERDYYPDFSTREDADMEDYFARDYQLQPLSARGLGAKLAGQVATKVAPKALGKLAGSSDPGAPKTGVAKAVEVAKDTKTAVGLITDGVGLATDIATGDAPKAIFDAIKLTVDGIIAAFHAIQDTIARDKYMRSGFTQEAVAKLRGSHPKMNFVICHTGHHYNFPGVKGKDWYHDHRELKVHFPIGSTIGYEIYGFGAGEFFREGDGGYLNWAYIGNVKSSDNNGGHVVFNKP